MDDAVAVRLVEREPDLVEQIGGERQCGLRMRFLERRERFAIRAIPSQGMGCGRPGS